MTHAGQDDLIPGRLLEGVVIPPNWERAYGYDGEGQFLAMYWAPGGDEAMADDGQSNFTANWWIFQDLVQILDGAGYVWARQGLGWSEEEAIHVLLLDLHERTVRLVEKQVAQEWLGSLVFTPPNSPLAQIQTEEDCEAFMAAFEQALVEVNAALAERWQGKAMCPKCVGTGWVKTENWKRDGYVQCPNCEDGLVPAANAAGTITIETFDLPLGE